MNDDPTPPAAGIATARATETPPSRWWEGTAYSTEERDWLVARGLTEDDPLAVLPKLVKTGRHAEQKLGRGVDSILDKPAAGQSASDWMVANRAAMGLPDKPEAYAVKPPEFWPKDAGWDEALAAKAQKLAFDKGIPPEVHQGYVEMFAQKMADIDRASTDGMVTAQETMMAELRRDFGDQTNAVIARARQATEVVAQKAGLSPDHILAMGQLMQQKGGDAITIRVFAAIADMMGEDSAVGIGRGGALTTTPAEARQQLAALRAPGGAYFKAVQGNDRMALAELQPSIEMLSRLASR